MTSSRKPTRRKKRGNVSGCESQDIQGNKERWPKFRAEKGKKGKT